MKDNFLEDLHEPKSELKEFDLALQIQRMIERVNEGYEDELKAYILFSDGEKAFKAAKESILEAALIERKKYDEKTLELMGKKISISQSGRYEYSHYEPYTKKANELKDIEELMKQSYISSQKGNMTIDENGEIIPAAIYKPSKESLKIS